MTNPKVSTLTDAFPGVALNTANWYVEPISGSPSGTVTVSSGTVTLANPANSGNAYVAINSGTSSISAVPYDVTDSAAFVKILPNLTVTNADTGFGYWDSSITYGWTMGVQAGQSYAKKWDGTGTFGYSTPWTAAYDATNHAWFRIREASGTLYFETSPDSVSWLVQYSTTSEVPHSGFSLAAADVQLYFGFEDLKRAGSGAFQNFNISAAPSSRGTAMSSLTDNFPGSSLSGQWRSYGTVSVSGNEVSLSSVATYSGIWSNSSYDLTSSHASVKLAPYFSAGTGADGYQTVMQLSPDGTAGLSFGNNGGTSLLATWSDSSGAFTTIATATYSATNHAYLMISESLGTVIFSTSANGSTWTTFATIADSALPFGLGSLSVQLYAGHWDGGSDGTAAFASFNTTTSSGGTRFTPVGSAFHATAATFSLTPAAVHDSDGDHFILAEVISTTSADHATALSSSNVNWSVLVAPQVVGSTACTVFLGEVTAAATATVTVTLSAGSPTLRIAGKEFSCSTGFAAVALDTSGTVSGGAAFPSLTPAAAGELYWGYALDSGTGSAGTTIGYSYAVDANGDPSAWNPGCTSAAQAPNAGGGGTRTGVAVLLTATPVLTPGWAISAIVPGALTLLGSYSGALSNISVGYVSDIYCNPNGTITGNATSAGWFTVQSYADDLTAISQVVNGYAGETAADRISRLCSESGIGFEITGGPSDTPQMGPQQDDTLVNVLQSCEDADRGVLTESRDQFGLAYRTRVSMCGQSPAVVYDWSGGQLASPPPQPVTDDQHTRNNITLSRQNGSLVVVTQATGPMSTQDPPNGAGNYTYSLTANLYSDSQLPNMAAWMLGIGTVTDARYPQIAQDLSRADVAPLMSATAGLSHGDWVQLINPPGQLTPGPIDQLVWGWTETLNSRRWTFSYNMVPESPYATGPQVLNVNPGFVSESLDGWTPFNGTMTATADPPPKCPAGFAALFTPNGSAPYGAIEGVRALGFPVTPGQAYLAGAYVYAVAGSSNVEVGVDWLDASGGYLSTSSAIVPPVLGTWVVVKTTCYAPAGAASAVARAGRNAFPGTVADTETLYATNIEVIYPVSTW